MKARSAAPMRPKSISMWLQKGAMVAAFAVLAATIGGCDVPTVRSIVAAHSPQAAATLTDTAAQAIADRHNADHPTAVLASVHADSLDTSAVTPEMAKAIAWTALVVEQQKQAAALPCHTSKGGARICTTAAQWAALRKCESGGVYTKVQTSGKHRGAYQMDADFWRAYGDGSAPTADKATPASQDAAAYKGFRARGWQPWTCRSAVPGA